MKCHKCNAENINEAVRCGICGVRLKHQQAFDDFTGSHIRSLNRGKRQKQHILNQDAGIKPYQHSNSNQSLKNEHKAKNEIRKLFDITQEKILRAQGRFVEHPLKNKKVFIYIVWAVIIFVLAILDGMNSNAIP
ncbi:MULTISPECIES: hypothetical protein [unclassified Acinetobacter]|uniref:hypothetical protein n=1 Tax=unclassified Acinetobacter TaxID=196816 RepID=UPI002575B6F5|nr:MULTISPECIES: hypothetical protein [unclassified Acinetobacter]MDM1755971.1 hypothetical protein [Acinetobacter sp. 256-1]MDM1760587.1 hypothetical protein [Acinetobacter sp. 251-1]